MCKAVNFTPSGKPVNASPSSNRRLRYLMLDTAAKLMNSHRIATCSKHVPKYGVASEVNGIVLSKNAFGRAYYSGVNICSNVWGCPICAEKIGSKRAEEVSFAINKHVEQGGWGLFLTLTFSHKKQDDLLDILNSQAKANTNMRASRKFKALMKEIGLVGSIKALETTHGANGWHPHTHEVMLVESKLSEDQIDEIKSTIYDLWSYYCEKNGLGKPNRQGVDVQIPKNMESMARYVSKWGYELTHLNIKAGKNGSRTPFQILADLSKKFSPRDSFLYKEFVKCFKGRRQLRWSKGLKALFDLEELTDIQLNEAPEREIITVIPKQDWYNVLAADKRAELLEKAETGGAPAVKEFLERIEQVLTHTRKKAATQKHFLRRKIELETDLFFDNGYESVSSDHPAIVNLNASYQRDMYDISKEEKEIINLLNHKKQNIKNIRQLLN